MVVKCCVGFLSARRLGWALWKKYVLGKPCLGMSYSAVEFNVDDSAICIK